MLRYVLRRFLLLIPMVLAASVIIFLMLRLGTGDPALDYLRLSNLPPTPEMLALCYATCKTLSDAIALLQ